MNRSVVIVGATSAIARAIANEFAGDKHDIVLAARDVGEMERIAGDLRVRQGIQVACVKFDAEDLKATPRFWDECLAAAGGEIDGIVIAHGFMVPQADAQSDPGVAAKIIDINFTSPALLLNAAAPHFEAKKAGFVCAITSVAGDRGRQSNYVYGSAKAGLTTFLQGLRVRLAKSGVNVTIVKPGFVDTSMTWGLLKPDSPLVASPQRVARDIAKAIRRGKPVIYTPWFWWGIMAIIRNVPDVIFKKMKM
jgi:decaprenylphospho-beta-D-erythro-pentofuranosid-2-ulose 2-reductase